MMNVLEHKGYSARIELDPEDECFVGRLAGIDDGIGFHGSTIAELKTAFHEAVDDYVETCRHLDKQPQRPFSGNDKPRITLSITIDGTAEIWVNPAGRDLLVQHLTTLSSSNDHFHFGEGMDVELSPRPYSETDTVYEWGKVYFRPDDWDRKYFPHVFATSEDKPDH